MARETEDKTDHVCLSFIAFRPPGKRPELSALATFLTISFPKIVLCDHDHRGNHKTCNKSETVNHRSASVCLFFFLLSFYLVRKMERKGHIQIYALSGRYYHLRNPTENIYNFARNLKKNGHDSERSVSATQHS